MFDLYNVLLFFHILLAIAWVGSGILLAILAVRAQKSPHPDAMARFAGDAQWVGTKVLGPISGILLLFGIGLVLKGPWGFSDIFILIAIAGWAASAAIGALYLGPQGGKLEALLNEKGSTDPAALEQVRKVVLASRLDLLILIVVVADMVFKPGL
jgi:hypothetical protein